MPRPEPRPGYDVLLVKAREDLASRGVEYPFTHDLARLADLLGDVPAEVDAATDLMPWSVVQRYEDVAGGHLDREDALRLARAAVGWATDRIGAE